MNQLTLWVAWGPVPPAAGEQAPGDGGGRFARGRLALQVERTHALRSDDLHTFYDEGSQVLCALIGYVGNLEEVARDVGAARPQDAAVAAQLYAARGLDALAALDGIFAALIYDFARDEGYVVQSEFGAPLPLYYTALPEGLLLSTRLRAVLRRVPARELCREAAYDFLSYEWFIPNEATLVRGVAKVPTGLRLRILPRARRADLEPAAVQAPALSRDEAAQMLLPSIQQSVQRLHRLQRRPQVALPLTGGWDSTLMLTMLQGLAAGPVRAVTVDGGVADGELNRVAQLLPALGAVAHEVGRVPRHLRGYPDLVWRYEGYVFQEGIFLRHELARLLSPHGPLVYCAAAADQILYRMDHQTIRKRFFPPRSRNLYYMKQDYLVKMHELAFNGYGLQGLYPFVNRLTAACGRALGEENKKKALYREQVRAHLPPEIHRHLKKSGAVVATEALADAEQGLLLRVLGTELARWLLTPQMREGILAEEPGRRHLILLQLVYLHLFNELLLSGSYDARFDEAGLDLPLAHFLPAGLDPG